MSTTLATALNAALQAHRAGHLDIAVTTYGAILAIAPDHATARHLRGFALLQLGRTGEALGDLNAAVRADPANGNAWSHLAVCLDQQGCPATVAARRALLLTPTAHEALDVLVRDPDWTTAALTWLLALIPGDPAAWSRAGLARAENHRTAAHRALRRAQCLAPSDPSPRLDLADIERRGQSPETALRLASQCLVLRPHDPRAFAERAAAATELDAVADALADTGRALVLDPAHTTAWGNRGEAWYRLADYPAAVQSGTRALVSAPTDPGVRANLAAYRLATGDLAGGWPLFRNRPAHRTISGPALPRWSDERGARLLVLAEQGLGDELLFSTLWRDLDLRVAGGDLASATVEVDPRLIPLGARGLRHLTWRRRLADDQTGGPFTHWCLAGDLMEILRPEIDAFPGPGPGLTPDPETVGRWREWVSNTAAGRPAIGVCWRSGSVAGHRRRHYPALTDCASLLQRENTFFVVLQYDECSAEIAQATVGRGSEIAMPPDLDRREDQDGVAALMSALDLVVSADTAVLALAGAIGAPTVGFALHPGWVGLGQRDHPWFSRVERVYRAPDIPWAEAMGAVAARTEEMLKVAGARMSGR